MENNRNFIRIGSIQVPVPFGAADAILLAQAPMPAVHNVQAGVDAVVDQQFPQPNQQEAPAGRQPQPQHHQDHLPAPFPVLHNAQHLPPPPYQPEAPARQPHLPELFPDFRQAPPLHVVTPRDQQESMKLFMTFSLFDYQVSMSEIQEFFKTRYGPDAVVSVTLGGSRIQENKPYAIVAMKSMEVTNRVLQDYANAEPVQVAPGKRARIRKFFDREEYLGLN